MSSRRKALFLMIFIVALFFAIRLLHIKQHVSITSLQLYASSLHFLVQTHYVRMITGYIAIFVGLVVLGMPIVGPFALLGGSLFGFFPAVVSVMVSIVVGAMCSFVLIRYLLINMFAHYFEDRRKRFAKKIDTYGATYVVTLNLMMIVPFFVINGLAALSSLSLIRFVGATIIGTLPMVLVFVFAGKKFAELESIKDVFSPSIVIILLLLVCISFVPMIIKRTRYEEDFEE